MPTGNLKFIAAILGLALLIVGGVYLLKQQTAQKQKVVASKVQPPAPTSAPAVSRTATVSAQEQKQIDNFVAKVQTEAKSTDTLTLTKCIADPQEFKVKTGGSFSIVNKDNQDITVRFSPDAIFQVPAGKTISAKMTTEPAIYKYGCLYKDGVRVQAGVVYVTK